jgi:hypothetical protein
MNDLASGCAIHTSGGGGGPIDTLPRPPRAKAMEFVAEVPAHAQTRIAHNTCFFSVGGGGDKTWNIDTCRDIPSDRVVDLTFENARVGMTESSFGKSCQRPSSDSMNIRNIPSSSATQLKEVYVEARDDLSDVNYVRAAPRHPSEVPSFHAQCLNIGSQYDTPSQIDRARKLQARKVLERAAPKIKFSGRDDDMNFERFMERMEENMETEGVTDEWKVEYFESWFSGLAHQLVRSIKDNRNGSATEKLLAIRQVLESQFGSKKFDTQGMLRKMAEGGPIAGGDFETMQSFVVGLICKFELAKGKGDAGSFESKVTYYEILRLKLPHLIDKWSDRFETGREKVAFQEFVDFMMEKEKADRASATIRSPTGKAKSPQQGRRSDLMGPFASGHPDTSADGRRLQEQRRPRSDDRKTTGCKICSEEHQVADCKEFLAMGLDEKVGACRSRFMCFKCLDDTSHNYVCCRRSAR